MDVSELDAALLEMLDRLSLLAPYVNVGSVFQETCDMESRGSSLCDIGGEGEKLTCTLCTKHDCHQANEELNNGIFPRC